MIEAPAKLNPGNTRSLRRVHVWRVASIYFGDWQYVTADSHDEAIAKGSRLCQCVEYETIARYVVTRMYWE